MSIPQKKKYYFVLQYVILLFFNFIYIQYAVALIWRWYLLWLWLTAVIITWSHSVILAYSVLWGMHLLFALWQIWNRMATFTIKNCAAALYISLKVTVTFCQLLICCAFFLNCQESMHQQDSKYSAKKPLKLPY